MENISSFESFQLDGQVLQGLEAAGFTTPTPIQSMTIPMILDGKDIFAQAQTGSGKTGCFAIPIIQQFTQDQERTKFTLVLSPTRELAQQTMTVFQTLGKPAGMNSVCVIGGEDINKQKDLLSKDVHVIVATPGRFCDLLNQKVINTKDCHQVVFDEADRLFDMGFKKDIDYILSRIPKNRQLIMVSATSNFDVLNTAYKHHSHPEEVKLNTEDLRVDKINDQLAMISSDEKMPYLVNFLRGHEDAYAMIFCNTQFQTHSVAEWLKAMGFKAMPISGRMAQNKRTRLVEDFRNRDVTILVCTDVAARGLDINDINIVVNFDMPNEAASYVHRIGRTGRAGKSGVAISFCAWDDCEQLDRITEYLGKKIPKIDISDDDFATDLCAKPWIDAKTLKVVERNQQTNRNKKSNKKSGPKPESTKSKASSDPVQKESVMADKKSNRGDRFSVEVESYSIKEASKQAMKKLGLDDSELLGSRVLSEGARKFFIFGPKKTNFQFYVKPLYRKLLGPFLDNILKMSGLELNARITYKNPTLRVSLAGNDIGLLTRNRFELVNAFEMIIRLYLQQKVSTPRDFRVSVMAESSRKEQGGRTNSRGQSRTPVDEKKLKSLVEKTKKTVLESNRPVLLDKLNPAERRIVHQFISEDNKFQSESQGDGRFKRIEISLR